MTQLLHSFWRLVWSSGRILSWSLILAVAWFGSTVLVLILLALVNRVSRELAIPNWALWGIASLKTVSLTGLLQVLWFGSALGKRRRWIGYTFVGYLLTATGAVFWGVVISPSPFDFGALIALPVLANSLAAVLTSRALHRGWRWSAAWIVANGVSAVCGPWYGLSAAFVVAGFLFADSLVNVMNYLSFPIFAIFGYVVLASPISRLPPTLLLPSSVVAFVAILLLPPFLPSALIWRAMPARRRRAPNPAEMWQATGSRFWRHRRWSLPLAGTLVLTLLALIVEPRDSVEVTFYNGSTETLALQIFPEWTNNRAVANASISFAPGEARVLYFPVSHWRFRWIWDGPTVLRQTKDPFGSCRHVTYFAIARMGGKVDVSPEVPCFIIM